MKHFRKITNIVLFLLLVVSFQIGMRSVDVNAATLAAPKLISAKADNKVQITIKWQPVSGATGYYVYSRMDGQTFKPLKAVGNNTTYVHTPVQSGTRYYYTVRAYKNVNGKITFGTLNTKKSVTATTPLGTPELVSAKHVSDNRTKLTWNHVHWAEGYVIFKKVSGKWTRVGTAVNKDTWYDEKCSSAAAVYTVRSYRTNGTTKTFGGFDSNGISSDTYISTATLTKAYKAYADYLKKYPATSANAFELAYVDNNTLPELLIREGTGQGAGVGIYTYKNNTVVKMGTYGDYGKVAYAVRTGLIWESKTRQWYHENNIYYYANAKVSVRGKFKDTESDVNSIKYYVNGNSVSRSDYFSKLAVAHRNENYVMGGAGFMINSENINKLPSKPNSFIINKAK